MCLVAFHKPLWGRGLLWICFAASACQQLPAIDYGDPTSLNTPTTQNGIVALVEQPKVLALVFDPVVELVVVAYLENGEQTPLRVFVGAPDGFWQEAIPAPDHRFLAMISLTHGTNSIRIRIQDDGGSRTRVLDYPLNYQGEKPGIRILRLAPAIDGIACADTPALAQNICGADRFCLRGKASTRPGMTVTSVSLTSNQGTGWDLGVESDGFFEGIASLQPNQAQTFALWAKDSSGGETRTSFALVQDGLPPLVTVTSPGSEEQTRTSDPTFVFKGEASDENGIQSLQLQSASGDVEPVLLQSPWSITVRLLIGQNDFTLTATDLAGNSTRVPVTIYRERLLMLHPPRPSTGSTQLQLDRTALEGLLPRPEDQQAVSLFYVALRPSVIETIHAISDPAGHGVDTSSWGEAEWNFFRLINMSPDTANLDGSSIEQLVIIAQAIGLPMPRVLANLLGIGISTKFISMEKMTDVILEQLVGTHPAVRRDPDTGELALEITLYDVFQNMRTLSQRFGPAGEHPGFLTGDSQALVLEPGFVLFIEARSNLIQYDGIDASAGSKDYIFLGAGGQVLHFDFQNPDTFSVAGIADEPTVDLRIVIRENPQFFSAGTVPQGHTDPQTGFERGNGRAWDMPPWQTELIMAQAAFLQYYSAYAADNYRHTQVYNAGSIDNAASIDWDRGWIQIQTSGDIGNPPPPLYVWDMLLEVAQIRLHDGRQGPIPEGEANVEFSLRNLPVGLSADSLINALRPTLQAQESKLSDMIAGPTGLAQSPCDVFFVPSSVSGPGFLFFRAPSDSPQSYPYTRPGFFSDPELNLRVSTADALPGTEDRVHQKVPAEKSAAFYFQDDSQTLYRLEILGQNQDGITVRLLPLPLPIATGGAT